MTPADSPDHDLHDTRYAWFRLAVTLLVACVGNVGMWAVIVILPDMQAEFGIDRGTASLPYTATMAGFAIGSLAIGRWVDRYGITPCIIATAALMSAGYTLAVLSHSVWALVLLHFAIGFQDGTLREEVDCELRMVIAVDYS